MSYQDLCWQKSVGQTASDTVAAFFTLGACLIHLAIDHLSGIAPEAREVYGWDDAEAAKIEALAFANSELLPKCLVSMPLSLRSHAAFLAVITVATMEEGPRRNAISQCRLGDAEALRAIELDFLSDFPGPDLHFHLPTEDTDFVRYNKHFWGDGALRFWDDQSGQWTWHEYEVAHRDVREPPSGPAYLGVFASKRILHLRGNFSAGDEARLAVWKQALSGK
jgi:hypothetical protein